jgi:hypothetical protein
LTVLIQLNLGSASFRNADAAGEASGRYLGSGAEPGTIDLGASDARRRRLSGATCRG